MGTYAVVLAGGVGSRMKLNTPKQFLKLAGRAVLEHTLDNLERTRLFDGIVIVMHRESFEETKDSVPVSRYQTPMTIVPGGSTRNESSIEGLKAVYASGGSDSDKVLIHDAVRPFVNLAMLNRVIDGLDSEDAVDTAIPTADTIVRVNDEMYIEEVPRRDVLYRGQTPQGFKLGVIMKAFDAAVADGKVNFPDDCSVFLAYTPGGKIKVVLGDSSNIKLTDQVDLSLAEKIFQLRKSDLPKIDEAKLRSSLSGKVIAIFGASSGIGESVSSLASSLGMKVFGFSRSETSTFVEDEESVRSAIASVLKSAGSLDYVVNTAGLLQLATINELSAAEVSQLLNVNILGQVNVVRASLDSVRASGGSIVCFGSSSYSRGRANYALYSASKAALVNFVQAIAEEEPTIRINVLSPERTKTPMRVAAFGDEPGVPMLTADQVAWSTLQSLLYEESGVVIDVKGGADVSSVGIKA